MLKLIRQIAIAISLSTAAISQTTQPSCSPAIGAVAGQNTAITRTGVATPYSLTATIKTEMTLSDGNTISGFTTSRQARDSKGRTRVDNPNVCLADKDYQPKWQGVIEVTDPAAKTRTFWPESLTPGTKVANVTHYPSFKISNPPTEQAEYNVQKQVSQSFDNLSPEAKRHSQQSKVEDLGKRNIAGLEASGLKITRTWPAGAEGNSLPLVYVEEEWVSDRYGVILLDIKDDPIFGKSTYEVTNYAPTEPDASLFQPPADYKIEDRSITQ